MNTKNFVFLIAMLSCMTSHMGVRADAVMRHKTLYYKLKDSDMTATVIQPEYDPEGDEWWVCHLFENNYYNLWGPGDLSFRIENQLSYNDKEYTVTTVGKKAFAYLNQPNHSSGNIDRGPYLIDIELPETLVCIGDSAFFQSDEIDLRYLPGNITSFGKDVFEGCKTPYMNIGLRSIPDSLFHDCSIGTVNMNEALVSVGVDAFLNCGINKIVFSKGVLEIKSGAFRNVNGLNELWMCCDKPPTVASDAFGADGEDSTFSALLYVPEKDIDYYRSTFPWLRFSDIRPIEIGTLIDGIYYRLDPDSGMASVAPDDLYKVRNGSGGYYKGTVVVPENFQYEGVEYTTSEVGEWAFANCSLESVSLPQSIKKIGNNAFRNVHGPATVNHKFEVNLPESITEIGEGAFKGSTPKEIVMPAHLDKISKYMFYGSRPGKLTLQEGIEEIEEYAFANINPDYWGDLVELIVPRSVKKIGEKAFFGSNIWMLYIMCDNPPSTAMNALDNIEYSDWESYGVYRILVLRKDEEYYLTTKPWSKHYITPFDGTMDDPYFDRSRLVDADGILYYLNPELHLASIAPGWNFEKGCLDSEFYQGDIVVPEKIEYEGVEYCVSTIEPYAFKGAAGLRSISLPDDMVYIGKAAFADSRVRQFDWPSAVKEVEDSTFASAKLNRINLPEGVRKIGERAFAGCEDLSVVSLPSTLTDIEWRAFSQCRLKEIFTYNETPPSAYDAFYPMYADDWSLAANTYVYVPYGSASKYKNCSGWSGFRNIIEMSSKVPGVVPCEDVIEIYTLDGRRISADEFRSASLPHGVYVVRAVGNVRKVLK